MEVRWQQLYALQDRVLAVLANVEQEFYLSGGTALSREYCRHRYSEDLDFFVNDRPEFELWRDRCWQALQQYAVASPGYAWEILLREKRFGRAVLHGEVDLKLEFINDVPSRVGVPVKHPGWGLLDTRENILANKITALVDRNDPKDVADIFWLCCKEGLSLVMALRGAEGKAAGIFPPLVAKLLSEAAARGLPPVRWIAPPTAEEFADGVAGLVQALLRL